MTDGDPGGTPRRNPRLADIAAMAGLSVPTVSRALRDHPDVSQATRRLVKEAAERTGYRPNSVARALRTGRHGAVGFVMPYGLIGWWEPLLRGAGRSAAKSGMRIALSPFEFRAEGASPSVAEFFREAVDLPVDGFVVVTPDGDEWRTPATELAKPVVIIDDTRVHPGYHVWCSDNEAGAREAVGYLAAKGRRRIAALIPGDVDFSGLAVEDRLRGYRSGLRDAGLGEDVELVWHSEETYPPTLETSDAVDAVLAGGVEFDAIFALTDYVAFSALRSLRRAGVRVPEDVSVVGFDDDVASVALDPPLTTMRQRLPEIGAAAVHNVMELVAGDGAEPVVHKLSAHLVERASA